MADTKYNSLDPKLSSLFTNLEEQHGLPSGLLQAVAYTESRYNPNAGSKAGAQGMFQFMPATAQQYGVDVKDPVSSAQGAAKMYANLLKQYGGDVPKALAGYNWGSGNVQKQGMDKMPTETRNYISQITGLMGNQTEQKKNSINIPPEAMEAFNAYQAQGQQGNNMANNNMDGIPPEALKAFESYQQQSQQAQTMSAPSNNNGIPPEAMQAFNAYQQQGQEPQAQPVQTPVQTQQNNNAFGVYTPQTNMNAQSSKVAQHQNNAGMVTYQTIIDKANKGEDFTPVWNSLNPREKQYVGRLLQGAYKQDGQNTGLIENLWQGLTQSAQKTNDSIEQIGNYALSKISGNDKYINEKNQEVAKHQAIREMNDAMNPSLARGAGELGGDIAQFIGGEGIIKAGLTAAEKAAPGLIIKGSGLGARTSDLAVQGAGASILQNPVVNERDPNNTDFLAEKGKQALTGAVLAPVIGLPVEKAVGAIGGQVSKYNQAKTASLSAEDQAFINKMDSQGIRWFPSDLPSAKQDLIAKSQKATFNDKTMNSEVNAQQAEVTKAVQDAQDKLIKPDSNKILDETGLDKVLKDPTNPYHYRAKEIEEKIANIAPDDPNAILKTSAEAKLLSDKSKSRTLYDDAEKLVPANTKVELKTGEEVLSNAQKYMDDLATPSQRNQFKSVLNDIEATIEKAKAGQNSYADINKYFREMGDNARQAIKAGDNNGARVYNEFKSALNKDKDAFMNSLPDSTEVQAYKKAYSDATNFNKDNVQGIKNNKLGAIFEQYSKDGSPNLPDKLLEKWIKKGETAKVKTIYDALPDTGKQAVQSGVMNKIIKDALDANGDIIPKKLIANYKAYQDPTSGQTPLSIILEPSAKKTFDDLMATMGRLQNIGYNKANPINGSINNTVLKGLETMGTIASLKSGNVLAAIKPITNFIQNKAFIKGLTDPKFKKLLVNLNNLNPSKPAYAEKVGEIGAYLAQNYNY